MKQQTRSIDHLMDQVDMSEFDRRIAKAQIHRAEVVLDAIGMCVSGVSKLMKPLTRRKARGVQQH